MLTAIQVRNAKPREKAYKISDGKGLFLHIATSGKITWRYRYELPPGTESTFVIGEYPVLSLEEARVERAALREMVKAGPVQWQRNYYERILMPKYPSYP